MAASRLSKPHISRLSPLQAAAYRRSSAELILRTPEQVIGYFEGCELDEPGLVPVQNWRTFQPPVPAAAQAVILGGVGRKHG